MVKKRILNQKLPPYWTKCPFSVFLSNPVCILIAVFITQKNHWNCLFVCVWACARTHTPTYKSNNIKYRQRFFKNMSVTALFKNNEKLNNSEVLCLIDSSVNFISSVWRNGLCWLHPQTSGKFATMVPDTAASRGWKGILLFSLL